MALGKEWSQTYKLKLKDSEIKNYKQYTLDVAFVKQ